MESKYDSFIPNKIQIKYAKYILGVDKSATNLTVMSELGFFKCETKLILSENKDFLIQNIALLAFSDR
jgi:hypothetical protein